MELEIINLNGDDFEKTIDVVENIKEPEIIEKEEKLEKCEYILASGRRCYRLQREGKFCLSHAKKTDSNKSDMSDEAIISTMYTFQMVAYSILEKVRDDMNGVTEKLKNDKEKMEVIYKSILGSYGRDRVISYMNPLLVWLSMSGQHITESYINYKKNK